MLSRLHRNGLSADVVLLPRSDTAESASIGEDDLLSGTVEGVDRQLEYSVDREIEDAIDLTVTINCSP